MLQYVKEIEQKRKLDRNGCLQDQQSIMPLIARILREMNYRGEQLASELKGSLDARVKDLANVSAESEL
ncbi:unnamed protein product [Litomosoides sigmodontis]|uniref:Uncharacterized protein n=1 Tax=Litomosoides sigmodontis TaxID=42156 RepID=A0A3P6S6R2_LITSI|nr:unnamed protein product [Litomosoides sigmodontis]